MHEAKNTKYPSQKRGNLMDVKTKSLYVASDMWFRHNMVAMSLFTNVMFSQRRNTPI